jgi:hypothetical protein
MRRGLLHDTTWTLAAFGIAVAVSACGSAEDANTIPGTEEPGEGVTDPGQEAPPTPEEQVRQILDARKVDYGEAARTAKLKLNDELPTLAEIKQLEAATSEEAKKKVYGELVDKWIEDPKFTTMMIKFWKDTFRMGQVGQIQNNMPDKDRAPNFAAQITVEGRSYTELFTATSNTCPTFNGETGQLEQGSCETSPTVGVLTDPGLMSHYFANMAFRRVRFIQETFACSKFPAAYSATPKPMGNGTYTGMHPFESITGALNKDDARVDFHDTSAVICANCHNDMNHIAPLFLNYAENGSLQGEPQVEVPIPGNPKAAPVDYLPAGEGLAWRAGKPITDIASLGAAIAADPDVPRCAVNRIWNYAFSHGDIVDNLASVPVDVTKPYVEQFTAGGFKLKDTIREIFKGEDFVRF